MTKYRLSTRQQKELLIRHLRLEILLPCVEDEVDDPLAYSISALPEHASHVRSAEVGVVTVYLGIATPGLSGILGHIIDYSTDGIRAEMTVVVAQLWPVQQPRGSTPSPQWPGVKIE